jgi:hypothetical protein
MTKKLQVSRRALITRVNRWLADDGKKLKADRHHQLDEYYSIDVKRGVVIERVTDIEHFAREIGVLHDYERIAER